MRNEHIIKSFSSLLKKLQLDSSQSLESIIDAYDRASYRFINSDNAVTIQVFAQSNTIKTYTMKETLLGNYTWKKSETTSAFEDMVALYVLTTYLQHPNTVQHVKTSDWINHIFNTYL